MIGFRSVGFLNLAGAGDDSKYKKDGQTDRDFQLIARILLDSGTELIVLQGLLSVMPLIALRRVLGHGWNSAYANHSPADGYAFIWRSDRFSLTQNGNKQIVEPYMATMYPVNKPPMLGCFIPAGLEKKPFIELRLINAQIGGDPYRYIDDDKDKAEDQSVGQDGEYRKLITFLYDDVDQDRSKGNFRPAYTIMAGTYNLSCDDCNGINAAVSPKMVTCQQRSTRLNSDKKDPGYDLSDCDHFTFKDELSPYIRYTRIDAVAKYCNGDFAKYRKAVSMHVPIMFEINLLEPQTKQKTLLERLWN